MGVSEKVRTSHSTLPQPHIRPYPTGTARTLTFDPTLTKIRNPSRKKTTFPGSHLTLPHFYRFTFDRTPHEAKLEPLHIRPCLKPAIREPTPLEQLHSLVSNQPAPLAQLYSLVSNQPALCEQLHSLVSNQPAPL